MKNTVTQAYIMGIKEGRAFLTANPGLTRAEMESCLDAATRLMRDFSDDMKEMFKGERDFWKNQLKNKAVQ